MKYVAMLSGGKDSCFNIMHCDRNGHELIAAASLGPKEGQEELDSYLYQTVGQDAIEFVAQALDVPLYRKVISGSAVEQGLEYGGRNAHDAGGIEGDETEDLHELLSVVKNHHPDVQGVSVGAILSNYQRVRVEHVCSRLTLTPLCYLWQRDQAELLSEMIHSGMDAIIIKIAGIGLTTKHLGRTISDMQPTLFRLNELYGAHICGEGGEYESLTVDCPLFKRRIAISEVETVIHSDNDFATVAYLRIKKATLIDKRPHESVEVPIPSLLSDDFNSLRAAIENPSPVKLNAGHKTRETRASDRFDDSANTISSKRLGQWVAVANVQKNMLSFSTTSLEDEISECFENLQKCLASYSLIFSNVTNINILLSSMDFFPAMNNIYKHYFGTSPPARACLATDLPPGIRIRVDCIAFVERSLSDRHALHVQGLSYWAPANIGPYSQAVTVNERIFISGQIGMIPCKLTLPSPPSFATEAALSFQHVSSVAKALQSGLSGSPDVIAHCALCWVTEEQVLLQLRRAWKFNRLLTSTPTLFIGIRSLPKGALIENQIIMHTGRSFVVDDDGTETMCHERPILDQGESTLITQSVYWETYTFPINGDFCAVIAVKGGNKDVLFTTPCNSISALRGICLETLSIRLIHKAGWNRHATSFVKAVFDSDPAPALTHVPAQFISTRDVDGWDFALCIFGTTGKMIT